MYIVVHVHTHTNINPSHKKKWYKKHTSWLTCDSHARKSRACTNRHIIVSSYFPKILGGLSYIWQASSSGGSIFSKVALCWPMVFIPEGAAKGNVSAYQLSPHSRVCVAYLCDTSWVQGPQPLLWRPVRPFLQLQQLLQYQLLEGNTHCSVMMQGLGWSCVWATVYTSSHW